MVNRAELTRQFCRHWLEKAAQYDATRLEDAFDKFFTLFVAFNRLYFYAAQVAGQPNVGDRRMATRLFPEVVGHDLLWQRLTDNGGEADIRTLQGLIGPDGSFFLISRDADPDANDPERDNELRRLLGSKSHRVVVEAVLEFVYQVRCNMFHGAKGFENRQLQLLQPCLWCLDRVIAVGLEKVSAV
jgi:hypothetical protein